MTDFRRRALAVCITVLGIVALSGCDYFVSPEARVERAEKYAAEGDQRRALVELRNALKAEPDMVRGRLLLAEVALWLGDVDAAERELAKVPESYEPVRRTELAIRIDLAQQRFQAAFDHAGSRALYRAYAQLGLGNYAQAEAEFDKAIAAPVVPRDVIDAQVGIAEAAAAQGDLKRAVMLAGEAAGKYPDSAQAHFVHGVALARSGDLDGATKALQRARELSGRQLDTFRQIALLSTLIDVQLAARDIDGARASAAALSRLASGSPIATLMDARVAMAAGDNVAAAANLRRLVNSAPQFVQARFLLGVVLTAQGNLEQASSELATVVEQSPQNLEARQLLAQVRLRLADPDGALRVLVPALQDEAADPAIASLFDAARIQSGGAPQSTELLERALAKTPGNRELALQLASAYLQAGAPRKAVDLLRRTPIEPADVRAQSLRIAALVAAEGIPAGERQVAAMLAGAPDNVGLINVGAVYFLRAGKPERARALLDAALERHPRDVALWFARAQLEWQLRRPDESRAALEHVLVLDANNENARLALAQLALARGDRAAARAELETIRSKDPRAVNARLQLARIALEGDDAKLADLLVAEALAADTPRGAVRNSAGLLYLSTGRFDQASAHFRAGTEADPTNALLWLNLARSQIALNQPDAARASLQRSLALQPGWIQAEGALAFLDLQQGNRTAAIERVVKLRQARPRDPQAVQLEGELRFAVREYPEAVRALEAAAALQPSAELAAHTYEARLAGRLPNPEKSLETWVERHPDDAGMRALLAESYTRTGNTKLAVAEYERIVARRPNDATTLNNLAWLYHEVGDARALALARRAHALAPQSSAIADTLGWVLIETGGLAEGIEILRRAAAARDATPDIHYHLAAGLAKSGARDEALETLRPLLRGKDAFSSRADADRLLAELSKGQP